LINKPNINNHKTINTEMALDLITGEFIGKIFLK